LVHLVSRDRLRQMATKWGQIRQLCVSPRQYVHELSTTTTRGGFQQKEMSGSNLKVRTAPVYEPLLQPARYKGAWGGRGTPLLCAQTFL
jgi:hypothetical protein